jgi:hypothetical protein
MPAIGVTRVHGGVGVEGQINGETGSQLGGSLAFYHIQLRNASLAAIDVRGEMAANPDGGLGLGVEAVLRACPQGILSYNVANNGTGNVYIVTDGVNSPTAAELQTTIRDLGTTVGSTPIDVSGTLVTKGTTFTVA